LTQLTADDLRRPIARRIQRVDLPEFGEGSYVFVRALTAREKSAFESTLQTSKGKPNRERIAEVRERLVVLTVCDEHGTPTLSDSDIGTLASQDAGIMSRIADVAGALCGLTDGDIEELAGNLNATTGGDSQSDSL